MEKLLEIKSYLVNFYGTHSKQVDKSVQFVVALLTFIFIGSNLGFSSVASNPIMILVLSVICTFLPMTITVVVATVAVLMQFYTLSFGIAAAAGIIFFVMYILYFRYTPQKAMILLLVPISFMLNVPVLIPILYGLVGSPICILPIAMGTMIYYMVDCVQSYSTLLETTADSGTMGQLTLYTQQLFTSREMWCTMIAFAVCLLLVYSIRRMAVDHSWAIGIVTGALSYLIVMATGCVMMDIQISWLLMTVGIIVAMLIAFVVEVLIFSVDYSRTEYLQFEDDEYYYHVKAVPKVSVAKPEKTVKRIHERKTEVIDVEQVKKQERLARQEAEDSEIQRIIEEELNRS